MKIGLGKKVKDVITGLEGIVTSRHEYLTGCAQYGIQAPIIEYGKIPDVVFLDENRLIETGDGVDPSVFKSTEPGCDCREHPK